MSPPAILHLNTETGWRGGEAQTLRLALGLEGRGFSCLVCGPARGALLERAAAAGLRVEPWEARGELDLLAARRLAGLARRESAALLHAHTAHAAGLMSLATLFLRPRPKTVAARRLSFPLRSRLLGRLKYRCRVDRVVAVSEAIRRRLIGQGLAPERIAVVHSGIDPGPFERGDRGRFRESLRPLLGDAALSGFLIGTAGHLAAHKGMDRFLEAAALAVPRIEGARFVVIGRGEEEDALRRTADRLGIAGQVAFAGFRDDMPDVFAGLDLFVLSSLSGEGSPAVLKEAMAAGTPLVATALDGVEEIVEDARHGLLVPPGSAPALAAAMVALARDQAMRARLSAAGRARASNFTLAKMVERTEAVYRSLGVVVREPS